jgi:RHS repeat-associated protein
LLSLLGFNGERPDPVTGHYHLGNGYRQFNPVLMRFNSPDSWSPFGEGGLNAYAYCAGDPINRVDPTGHWFKALIGNMTAYAQQTGKALRPQTIESLKKTISIAGGENAIAAHAKLQGITPEQNLIYKTLDWHMSRAERNIEKFHTLIKNEHTALNTEKINRAIARVGESRGFYSNIVKSLQHPQDGPKFLTSLTYKISKMKEKIAILNSNPKAFSTVIPPPSYNELYPPLPSYNQLFPTNSIARNIRS